MGFIVGMLLCLALFVQNKFPTWENKVYSYLLILKVMENRKYLFKDERIIWSKRGPSYPGHSSNPVKSRNRPGIWCTAEHNMREDIRPVPAYCVNA